MLIRRVIEHKVHNDAYSPFMRFIHEFSKFFQRAVIWRNGTVIRHIVTVVTQRGREEGKQPETIDAEPFDIVQFVDEPAKIPYSVIISVVKGFDVKLIKDGLLEPQWICHLPVSFFSLWHVLSIQKLVTHREQLGTHPFETA